MVPFDAMINGTITAVSRYNSIHIIDTGVFCGRVCLTPLSSTKHTFIDT